MSRSIVEKLVARPSSDGDGVKLLRVFGGSRPQRFDPFLLMDEFGSDEAADYIGGFPPHPHRGFETITYMLQGKMEHQDHIGNVGLLNDGDVQWMTAGKGIIHSEMPKQTEGKMRGFQLWLNLAADEKLKPASYQDIDGSTLPVAETGAASFKFIAGAVTIDGVAYKGAIDSGKTEAVLADVELNPGQSIQLAVAEGHNVMLYGYEGELSIGTQQTPLHAHELARLSEQGDVLINNAGDSSAKLMVIAGKPLAEPIAQYGPFVMNTMDEINQALADYREGTLTA